MLIKELIEELKNYDGDMEVAIDTYWGYDDIDSFEIQDGIHCPVPYLLIKPEKDVW